jgi:hypothetical protein
MKKLIAFTLVFISASLNNLYGQTTINVVPNEDKFLGYWGGEGGSAIYITRTGNDYLMYWGDIGVDPEIMIVTEKIIAKPVNGHLEYTSTQWGKGKIVLGDTDNFIKVGQFEWKYGGGICK